MVTLLKNGDNDWRAWALSVSIAIISGLVLIGVGNLTFQFHEMKTEIRDIRVEAQRDRQTQAQKDHEQDLCVRELQINQNERLEKERRGIK